VSTAFLVLAGVLTALSLVLLLRPLVRRREDVRPSTVTAMVFALALLLGGAGLYAAFSDYSWEAPPAVETPAARAAVLAKQLAKRPDNLEGWLELGEQYTALQQYPLAARAYSRADVVANGRSAPAIIGMAESLLAIDFEDIRGRSGRLFERVLDLEPTNLKGLFYGAIAAFSRGDTAEGRERFERLLALNPPANIRAIIEKQLQAIDAQVAAGPAPETSAGAPAPAQVQVHISVAPHLRFQLGPQSALFVLARDPNQPGPPFAAKRLPVQLPAEVTLTSSDAMLEQRRISAGQTLDVVARISLSGQPQSSSGDPFGQVSYHVGQDGKLNLVIDRLAP
jgi:cytochrome c-type biogenesis protein CcmH